jgi:hypothetical protein
METPRQKCARLLVALEDLVGQEISCVRTGDFAGLCSLQDRAGPLVTWLVEHGPAIADADIRRRIAGVLESRQRTAAALASEIARTRSEVDGLSVSLRTVARVAPVYGRAVPVRRQLAVVG